MSNLFDNITEVILNDSEWTLVDAFGQYTPVTIKNLGTSTVSVFKSTVPMESGEVESYLEEHQINPPEIGGIFYEISSMEGEKIFVRCPSGSGRVSVRLYGTVDPLEDVQALGLIINEHLNNYNEHVGNSNNPHSVTKDQVGLGNLPNAIASDVDSKEVTSVNAEQVLATMAALRQVKALHDAHAQTKKGNPHSVTKEEVGLGQVANYPPATAVTAMDITNNQEYLTPFTANFLIKDVVIIASTIKPQTVITGRVIPRPTGSMVPDFATPMTKLLEIVGSRALRVYSGLQVAYAHRGLCRISKILSQDLNVEFPEPLGDSTIYVYVDINENNEISNVWYHTQHPLVGPERTGHTSGDQFRTNRCDMVDTSGVEIRRVYIGKVVYADNEMYSSTSCPLGDSYCSLDTVIPLGMSSIFVNPFLAPVNTTALVRYGAVWGETKWNDQIGVLASPRPGYEPEQVLVQVGNQGYLARGKSAGSAFGSDFLTVTDELPIVVKMDLTY